MKCNMLNNILCNALRKHYLESRKGDYMKYYNWDKDTCERFIEKTTRDNCSKIKIWKNKTFEEKIDMFKKL